MSIIYSVLGFIGYLIVGNLLWKTFDFFKMNLWRHASMTGYDYWKEKFFFAYVAPALIIFFVYAHYQKNNQNDVTTDANTNSTTPVNQSSNESKPNQNLQQNNQSRIETEVVESSRKENQKTNPVYDGDDPIIRHRLGLPPKD